MAAIPDIRKFQFRNEKILFVEKNEVAAAGYMFIELFQNIRQTEKYVFFSMKGLYEIVFEVR